MERQEGRVRMDEPADEPAQRATTWLEDHGVRPNDRVGLALREGVGIGLAVAGARRGWATSDPVAAVGQLDAAFHPRWIWWDRTTSDPLAAADLAIARCWDVLTVHRLFCLLYTSDAADDLLCV